MPSPALALRTPAFERLAPDLDAAYVPALIEPRAADALFEALLEEVVWRQERIRMFGRDVPVPRLLAWVADPGVHYAYSGIEHAPAPWPARLRALREQLEDMLATAFPGVLLNRYRGGTDRVGWHSDDERAMADPPLIASVSLGAERRFVFRRRVRGGWRRVELKPAHGSLVLMWGRSQRDWQHALPRTRTAVGERVNLTFRCMAPSSNEASAS